MRKLRKSASGAVRPGEASAAATDAEKQKNTENSIQNTESPTPKPRRKRRRSRAPGFLYPVTVICLLVTVVSVAGMFRANHRLKQEEELMEQEIEAHDQEALNALELFDSIDNKETYSKLEVANLIAAAKEEYAREGREEVLDSIRTTIQEKNSTLEALRNVFKEYVILTDKNSFMFIPLLEDYPLNTRLPEYFSQNGDGTISYNDPSGFVPPRGIDVSSHQGTIDWEALGDADIDFAIIRTGYRGYSEGAIKEDTEYFNNMDGALSQGIHTGVYFFTQAVTEAEMQEEIDFILERLEGYKIDGPVVLDVEEVDNGGGRTAPLVPAQRTNMIRYFSQKISDAGYTPMVYGNLRSTMLMFELEPLKDIEMWYAYYSFPIYYPYEYSILQYSSTGKVPGINTDVDLNLCFKPWWD